MFIEKFALVKEWPPRDVEPPKNLDLRCHASTIAEAANGDLLAAWWEGPYELCNEMMIAGARLKAGSVHWSQPFVFVNSDKPDGNPVLFAHPNGRLWLFYVTVYGNWWNHCKVFYKTSDDNGHTWSEPVTLQEEQGWMLRHKPVVLSTGRIILPAYHESTTTDQINNYSFMLISDDEGQTWTPSEPIRSLPPNLQPTVIERSDGSLLALCRYYVYPRPDDRGRIWMSVSTDQGETWSEATRTSFPNPNSGADMVQTASGNLILAFNDATNKRTPLSLALSQDEGKTWPYRKAIETIDGQYDYPAIIQSSDGLLQLTYSYNHLKIKHVTFDEEWMLTP